MLLPSRVAGRTRGLRGPDLARGPEVARLWTRVMVMIVLMAFLAAGKARNGNFMPTFFRYMIGLSALPTLADNMPCRFCRGVAAH